MRERFMEVFDSITIDCLNGDKYKTGKKTPDGQPDPSVFSTEKNREGIQVGTAIALLERRPDNAKRKPIADTYTPNAELGFRHWWGKEKREELEASLDKRVKPKKLKPALPLGLPFVPVAVRVDYKQWPTIADILRYSSFGFLTNRDEVLVSIDRKPLVDRMTA